MDKVNLGTHEIDFKNNLIVDANNNPFEVKDFDVFADKLNREQLLALAEIKSPMTDESGLSKSNVKKIAISKILDLRILTNLSVLEENNDFQEYIISRIRLLRSMKHRVRKPYICRYPQHAIDEINWAIDRDSDSLYIQKICFKFDPFQPKKPSITQVRSYMQWYREIKRMREDEQRSLSENIANDGVQQLIDKGSANLSKQDLIQSQLSLLGKISLRTELLQRENFGVMDVDIESLIGKFIGEASEIIEKITKATGKNLPEVSANTVNIYNFTPDEIFKEIFSNVIMTVIRRSYPQIAGEMEKLIVQEFEQYMTPHRKILDITPNKTK